MVSSETTDLLTKVAMVAAGGIVIGGVGYAIIKSLGGPSGGACNDPSSPCYTATQPYVAQFQSCLVSYTSYLNQFVAADSAAGTGFTQAQQDTLSQLRSCMNSAATSTAQTAAQYQSNPLDYSAVVFTDVGAAALAGYAALKIYQSYRGVSTGIRTGSSMAEAVTNAIIQAAAKAGQITSQAAAAFSSQVSSYTSQFQNEDAEVLSGFADLGIVSADEAAVIASNDASAFQSDAGDVVDALGGFLGFTGYTLKPWTAAATNRQLNNDPGLAYPTTLVSWAGASIANDVSSRKVDLSSAVYRFDPASQGCSGCGGYPLAMPPHAGLGQHMTRTVNRTVG